MSVERSARLWGIQRVKCWMPRALVIAALFLAIPVFGQQEIGTAFTYQGSLENGSGPVTDTCDFRFGLWDADAAGAQSGVSPQTVALVDVVAGSFTVALDFGVGAINGDARWLEIEVQCPGDAGFVLLAPRVELTPAPHALRASTGVGPPAALEVDPATQQIGVGTNAPQYPLHVVGAINAQNPGSSPSGSNVRLGAPSNDPGLVMERGNGSGGVTKRYDIAVESDNSLEIRDNTAGGLERLMIDTTGRVGIGTTSPDEQLTVAGAIRSTTGGFKFPDGTTQTTAATGGGSGSTLDGAYDQGGPGAGRIITADSGAVEIQGPDGLHVAGAIQSGNSITIDGAAHTVSSDADIEIHVADGRVMRFESNPTAPNVIGGHVNNSVSPGVVGATIAGGGEIPASVYGYLCESGPGCSRCSVSMNFCITDANCPANETCVPLDSECSTPNDVCELNTFVRCSGGPNSGQECGICVNGPFPGSGCSLEVNCGVGGTCQPDQAACGAGGICGARSNSVTSEFSTVGGGSGNIAGGYYSTVAGGTTNSAMSPGSTIGGGSNNAAMELLSTVGGGIFNKATGNSSTVGGGNENVAAETCSTVGGGSNNTADGYYSTVGGGTSNITNGGSATVSGGSGNTADASSSSIAGGNGNTTHAGASFSTVPGGLDNFAGGMSSLAAGRRAIVRDYVTIGEDILGCQLAFTCGDEGTFAWADSTDADFTSTGPNQFLIRATGGMRLATGDGSTPRFQSILPSTNTPTLLALNPLGGNVGIGTSDPDVDLEVNGGTELSLTDGTGFLMLGDQDAVNLAFDTDEIQARNDGAAANLRLNPAGGNVGIGGIVPSDPLTVAGVIRSTTGGFELPDGTIIDAAGDLSGVTNALDASDGSPTNAVYVDAVGNVGIGTTTPDNTLLHVGTNDGTLLKLGNDPELAITRNVASDKFTIFVGGTNYNGKVLQIGRDDGNHNIGLTGNVGIGTNSPSATLDVVGGLAVDGNTLFVNSSLNRVGIGTTSPTEALHVVGDACVTGTVGSCSDRRYKKDVTEINDALGLVGKLRGVHFNWRRDEYPDREFSEAPQIGFIAQEIAEVVPEVVIRGDDGYYWVDYGRLTPVIVEAIKAQSENHNRQMENKNQQIAELTARLERLEQSLLNQKGHNDE